MLFVYLSFPDYSLTSSHAFEIIWMPAIKKLPANAILLVILTI